MRTSHHVFSWGAQALGRLGCRRCGLWTWLLCRMWDLPRSGIESRKRKSSVSLAYYPKSRACSFSSHLLSEVLRLPLATHIENWFTLQPRGLDFTFAELRDITRYPYNIRIYNSGYTHGNRKQFPFKVAKIHAYIVVAYFKAMLIPVRTNFSYPNGWRSIKLDNILSLLLSLTTSAFIISHVKWSLQS